MLSFRYIAARTIAPILPTDADSVGVAIPAKIDPKTKMISVSGGKIAIIARLMLPARLPV